MAGRAKKINHKAERIADAKDLAHHIAQLMLDKRAADPVIMEIHELTSIADFYIIASGDSDTQVKAIAGHVDDSLRKAGLRPLHAEGFDQAAWVLLDYGFVVAHIFQPETRAYYDLERLWADAPTTQVTDPEAE